MTPQQFADFWIQKHAYMVVTGPDKGQCTAVPHQRQKDLGLPLVYGNAKDMFNNAGAAYTKLPYKPGVVAPVGSFAVWDSTWGAGKGHTAFVLTSTPTSFTAFSQNDPTGSLPRINTYGYTKALVGFYYSASQGEDMLTPAQINQLTQIAFNRPAIDAEKSTYNTLPIDQVLQRILDGSENLSLRTDAQAYRNGQSSEAVDKLAQIKKIIEG